MIEDIYKENFTSQYELDGAIVYLYIQEHVLEVYLSVRKIV